MKKNLSLTVLAAAMALSGCAGIQDATGVDGKTASAMAGGVIGCAAGALLAQATKGNALAGCAAGAAVGGLIGFEKARQEEIAAAEQTRREVIATMSQLPAAKQPVIGEIKTSEVSATDKSNKQSKKYQSFDSMTVDLPISTRGTPEHRAAIEKLKTLAERVADERGSAELSLAMTPSDAKAQKVSLETVKVPTRKGSISVITAADPNVPKGIQRVTVRAGKLQSLEV